VFGAYDSLGLDCYSVLADVWPAQVIQKTRACERVVRGAAVRVVLVTNDEESHVTFTFDLRRSAEHQVEQAAAPASPLSVTKQGSLAAFQASKPPVRFATSWKPARRSRLVAIELR
jgi:hypothetical protein